MIKTNSIPMFPLIVIFFSCIGGIVLVGFALKSYEPAKKKKYDPNVLLGVGLPLLSSAVFLLVVMLFIDNDD